MDLENLDNPGIHSLGTTATTVAKHKHLKLKCRKYVKYEHARVFY